VGWGRDGEINVLREASTHGNSTANLPKLREAIDGGKVRVVLDSQAASSLLKEREANVADVIVVPEGDIIAGGGQVGGDEGLHGLVLGELDRVVDGLEKRNAKALDTTNVEVGGPGETGKGDLKVGGVVSNDEPLADAGHAGLPGGEALVVVDLEGTDRDHAEAIKAGKEGVGDTDGLNRGDSVRSKADILKLGKTDPRNLSNGLQSSEVEAAQTAQTSELELSANGFDGRAGEGVDVGSISDDQVAGNGLRAANVDNAGKGVGGVEDDRTLDSLAGNRSLCGRGNRDSSGRAERVGLRCNS